MANLLGWMSARLGQHTPFPQAVNKSERMGSGGEDSRTEGKVSVMRFSSAPVFQPHRSIFLNLSQSGELAFFIAVAQNRTIGDTASIMQSIIHPQGTTNLHTHSFYCGHGVGTIADYERAAQAGGLTLLGFSEHCPFPDDRYHRTRMDFREHPAYERDVEAVRKSSSLEILLGYECDYHRHYHTYLSEVGERVDYLIGGVHYLNTIAEEDEPMYRKGAMAREDLVRYANRYTQMIQSGLFLYGVHPDLFAIGYHLWDEHTISISRAIIECAIDANMPLEINGYGLQKLVIESAEGNRHAYPSPSFWNLASEYPRLLVVTSSDAHKPGDVTYGREETVSIAQNANITLASYQLEGREVSIV